MHACMHVCMYVYNVIMLHFTLSPGRQCAWENGSIHVLTFTAARSISACASISSRSLQVSPQGALGTYVSMRSPASESGSEGRQCDYEAMAMNNSSSDSDSDDGDMYVNCMNSPKGSGT